MQKLVELVKDTCDARLHWGKAGWPRYNGCFDGSTVFGATWCDFGCAVEVSPHHPCALEDARRMHANVPWVRSCLWQNSASDAATVIMASSAFEYHLQCTPA